MRTALLLAFLACMALTFVAHAVLPETVAIHFGAGGAPDGWAPKMTNTLIFLGLYVLLFVMYWRSPRVLAVVPSRWVSLPHKEYWLEPEHQAEAARRLGRLMAVHGVLTFAFFAVVSLLTIRANLETPVRLAEGPFLVALVLYLAATAGWCVWMFRSFRPPATSDRSPAV